MSALVIKCGIAALLTGIVAIILKELRTEWGTISALTGGVMISLAALTLLENTFIDIGTLVEKSGIEKDQLSVIVKCMGLCYVVDFSAGFCRNVGQTFLASSLEFAGKVSLCILSIPFVLELLDLVNRILAV